MTQRKVRAVLTPRLDYRLVAAGDCGRTLLSVVLLLQEIGGALAHGP
jgi:hypothetical protein